MVGQAAQHASLGRRPAGQSLSSLAQEHCCTQWSPCHHCYSSACEDQLPTASHSGHAPCLLTTQCHQPCQWGWEGFAAELITAQPLQHQVSGWPVPPRHLGCFIWCTAILRLSALSQDTMKLRSVRWVTSSLRHACSLEQNNAAITTLQETPVSAVMSSAGAHASGHARAHAEGLAWQPTHHGRNTGW